jgi:hypothetical protein
MKNLSLFSIAFYLFCFSNLLAQDFAKERIWEIGGRINYSSVTSVIDGETRDNSLNTFTLNVPLYYFITDGLELGLIPEYENLSSGGNSASLFAILAGIAYNIETQSAAYPYIEGRFGYNTSSNGSTRSGILWSLNGGVKVQVGGNALIIFGLFYEQRTLETSGNTAGRVGTNTWGIDAGLAFFISR